MTKFKFGAMATIAHNQDVQTFKDTLEAILSLSLSLVQQRDNFFAVNEALELEFETDGTAFHVEESRMIPRLYYGETFIAEFNPDKTPKLTLAQAELESVLAALLLAEKQRGADAPSLEEGDEFIEEFTFGKKPHKNKSDLAKFTDAMNSISPGRGLLNMYRYDDEGYLQFNTSKTLFYVIKSELGDQRLFLRTKCIAHFDLSSEYDEPLALWQYELDRELQQLDMPLIRHAFSLFEPEAATTGVCSGAILPNNTAAASANSSWFWLLKVLASSALITGLALILIGTWGGGLVPILGGNATAIKLGLGGFVAGGAMLSVGLFGGRRDDAPHEQQASCFSSCFPGQ
jgi:hypothetical protein